MVSFVKDEILPCLSTKDMLIGQDDLVRGDADVKVVFRIPTNTLLFPLLLIPVVRENLEARKEFLEFL